MEYVYFISDEHSHIKIGRSDNPKNRLASLQGANADKLTLLAIIPLKDAHHAELGLHALLDDTRIRGEWFNDSPRLRSLIETLGQLPQEEPPEPEYAELGDLLPETEPEPIPSIASQHSPGQHSHLRIDADTKRALQELSQQDGTPMAELVRRAVKGRPREVSSFRFNPAVKERFQKLCQQKGVEMSMVIEQLTEGWVEEQTG